MNRTGLIVVILACPLLVLAQTSTSHYAGPNYASHPYTPAVPAPSMTTAYGAYPGYGGGTTAAGSALNGLGNAMSGAGNMHLSNSAAAINWTQAQKNEMQNKQLGQQTYFQMRDENEAYEKAHERPQATKEQLAQWAREAAPKAVTPSEVDPKTGKIAWPDVLQQDSFAQQRAQVEQFMAKKTTYGRLSYADQMAARKTIETMFGTLKSQIQDIPPQDFVVSQQFLRSMIYATSKTDI